jgi:hypothetical protein
MLLLRSSEATDVMMCSRLSNVVQLRVVMHSFGQAADAARRSSPILHLMVTDFDVLFWALCCESHRDSLPRTVL